MICHWQMVASVPKLDIEPFVEKTRWVYPRRQGSKLDLLKYVEDFLALADFNVSSLRAADGTLAFLLYDRFMGWRLIMTDLQSV